MELCGPICKAAIDCTGYRCEMDREVDLIIAGVEDREDVIDEFNEMSSKHEKDWNKFVEKNHDF